MPMAFTRVRPLLAGFAGLVLASSALSGCAGGPGYKPERFPGYPIGYQERGMASWYGPGFHGNRTANGERYDMHKLTAAHRTLPFGSIVAVRSRTTGRTVTVRINDRGPFARGRILDLSLAGAKALSMTGNGTDEVELRVVGYQGANGDFGWLRVQVGSFADLQNAKDLLARLKGDYPGGRIVTADLPEGRRYRVQVGQFGTEAQAQHAATRLERLLDTQPFIVRDDA